MERGPGSWGRGEQQQLPQAEEGREFPSSLPDDSLCIPTVTPALLGYRGGEGAPPPVLLGSNVPPPALEPNLEPMPCSWHHCPSVASCPLGSGGGGVEWGVALRASGCPGWRGGVGGMPSYWIPRICPMMHAGQGPLSAATFPPPLLQAPGAGPPSTNSHLAMGERKQEVP